MNISNTIDPKKCHYIRCNTGDQFHGRDVHLVSLSGRSSFDFIVRDKKGKSGQLKMIIPIQEPLEKIEIPQKPDYSLAYQPIFLIREWKVDVGLNLIYNYGQSEDTSFSVQFQGIESSNQVHVFGDPAMTLQKPETPITLICDVHSSGRDVHFWQIAFQLDLLVCFAGYAV